MERYEVINSLSQGRFQDYLEIGVDYATTFNLVDIPRKVGVDPEFKVPRTEIKGEAYAETSDAFFERHSGQYDCVFVDGLHTYQQSKRDFLNGWKSLKSGGVVVIDDCRPVDEISALPDVNECLARRREQGKPEDMTWMGDVYKTVLWINDFTNYSYAYVKNTQGIVVVLQKEARNRKRFFAKEIEIENCEFNYFKTLDLPQLSIDELVHQVSGGRNPGFLQRLFGRGEG